VFSVKRDAGEVAAPSWATIRVEVDPQNGLRTLRSGLKECANEPLLTAAGCGRSEGHTEITRRRVPYKNVCQTGHQLARWVDTNSGSNPAPSGMSRSSSKTCGLSCAAG